MPCGMNSGIWTSGKSATTRTPIAPSGKIPAAPRCPSITYEVILQAVGYSKKHAKEIAAVRREEEAIDMVLQRPA